MKDYDQVFKEMDNVFKEMDKVFKHVEKSMESMNRMMGSNYVARKMTLGPWKPWFAWRPVKFKGKRVWLKKIYRRTVNTYVDMDDWSRYEYGDIFDVIKDAK